MQILTQPDAIDIGAIDVFVHRCVANISNYTSVFQSIILLQKLIEAFPAEKPPAEPASSDPRIVDSDDDSIPPLEMKHDISNLSQRSLIELLENESQLMTMFFVELQVRGVSSRIVP
jgi:hypothetical protein